ncbi:MAG: erythromycin esterase family protein [Pseudomonadota bacterium]
MLSLVLAGISACGGGGGTSEPEPPPPTSPAPPQPPTGLLTNEQLATPADSNAGLADSVSGDWFAANAEIVRSLTEDSDFSDLGFIDPLVRNKRLILLGESSHGVEEFSSAKIRLIKYLHEQQGYNVLALEGGLFDCERGNELLTEVSAFAAMRSCAFGVWRTDTVLELFEYVRSTQLTANPLRITGFDVQSSGDRIGERPARTAGMFQKLSPARAEEVLAIEQNYRNLIDSALGASSGSDRGIVDLRNALPFLQNDYATLAAELRANIDIVTADGEFSVRDVEIVAQYLQSSPYFAEQNANRFMLDSGGLARDLGMARNLIALAEVIYPDEKILVWAHNAHLRHQGTGFLPDANMGKWVHDSLEAQMYTVGFYMYRGSHAFNDRSIQTVSPPLNNSLEAIFHTRRLAWLFLDLENADTGPGSEWLRTPTPTWAWGQFQINLQLHDEYDALFIVDSVNPPNYVN